MTDATETKSNASGPGKTIPAVSATFIGTPLRELEKEVAGLGLPGLGPAAKEALQKTGIDTPFKVFLKYLLLNRNDDEFIKFLVDSGVKFVGGGTNNRTVEEVKKLLCDTLRQKYEVLSHY